MLTFILCFFGFATGYCYVLFKVKDDNITNKKPKENALTPK
jgi:hypothetical protein